MLLSGNVVNIGFNGCFLVYLHWTNDRFIFTEISRLSVAGTLPYINGTHYHHCLSAVDYHSLFMSFFFRWRKRCGFSRWYRSLRQVARRGLDQRRRYRLRPSFVCSLKIHHKLMLSCFHSLCINHKSLQKDIHAYHIVLSSVSKFTTIFFKSSKTTDP